MKHLTGQVRFSAKDQPPQGRKGQKDRTDMEWAEILSRTGEFRDIIKAVEFVPERFRELVHTLIQGDTGMAERLEEAIRGFNAQIGKQRKFERLDGGKIRIQVGKFDEAFEHRTNIYPSSEFDFDEFLNFHAVFGKKKRVLVALTGWTKPPAHYLTQDHVFRELLAEQPQEQWPQYSEKIYVGLIKKYLENVVTRLKEEGYNTDDVAFLYGVTPIGVDRAIEEFCEERGIRYAGVTCYDWIPYVDDVPGKKPFFLARDPKEFAHCMANYADMVIVMGGRAYASNISESGKTLGKGANPFIAADLFAERGIQIPPAVISDLDGKTSVVENAAAVLKVNPKSSPSEQIKRLKLSNPHNDPESVVYVTHRLKQALDRLFLVREAERQK